MDIMIYIWLSVICLGFIIEMVDAGTLVSIWFSAGAVIPLIMSFFSYNATWFICVQVLIFGVVTALCLIFLRKFALKALFKNGKAKTNIDTVIGRQFKITKQIEENYYVKTNGVEYNVVEENEKELKIGDFVKIIKVEGNKFIVEKVEKGE